MQTLLDDYQAAALKIANRIMTWAAKMAGMPYTNELCFVLCRQARMPSHVPTLPPAALSRNSRFSGMRLLCLAASFLSCPISRNV